MTLQEQLRQLAIDLPSTRLDKPYWAWVASIIGDADEVIIDNRGATAKGEPSHIGWIFYLHNGLASQHILRDGEVFEMHLNGRDGRYVWSGEQGSAPLWLSEPCPKTTAWRLIGTSTLKVGEAG